jgi:glutaminyl-tRNA synthetase
VNRPSGTGVATDTPEESGPTPGLDFIRSIVAEDQKAGRYGGRVVTRFPPEPNGFLHIGHAASVCLNFGIAEETGGVCNLRFDDTNPETEDVRYVESIIEDVRWLGFDWEDRLFFASDYFETMYRFAEHLIREGKAYVDSLGGDEIREYRGTVAEPGRPSPYRDRSVEENLDLFRRMRAGEFPDGAHVLRARLDLASPNMLLRDPILYRIRHAHHYRTGDDWCIYPLYDFAHPIEDALECVTHSICTLEFENNRPLYDWIVESIPVECRPRQYEFARRNLDYTITSKRKLLQLVREGRVTGWDDPRMPTVAGLRRRGVTPEAIRVFADLAGVGRTENRVDIGKLEFAIRDHLNQLAPRVLCVLRPLRVVITNYPEDRVEELEAPYFPRDVPREGSRKIPFSREILIERDDFMEDPPRDYHRLSPGAEVRLRYGYVIRCDEVVRGEDGQIVELRCSYDPESRSGGARARRSVRGTIHWVSAEHALPCEVRLYDRLFSVPDPEEGEGEFTDHLNPESLVVVNGAMIEPSVADDAPDTRYQFERLGYFWRDPEDSRPEALVFNRTVTLRDTWARSEEARPPAEAEARGVRPKGGQEGGRDGGRDGGRETERKSGGESRSSEPPRDPELASRRQRYVSELGVGDAEAEIVTRSESSADFFEAAVSAGAPARSVANWLVNELPRELGGRSLEGVPLSAAALARLVRLVEDETLSSSAGREVLAELVAGGGDPEEIVERRGLTQISDEAVLLGMIDEVIRQNPAKVAEYRSGRTGLLGFFVGQVMRSSGGRANPELVKRLIERALAGS